MSILDTFFIFSTPKHVLKSGHLPIMTLSIEQLDILYRYQAAWTRNFRKYIFRKINLFHKKSILEIGCGTGVVSAEISSHSKNTLTSVDKNFSALQFAKSKSKFPNASFINADCEHLPFPANSFSVIISHYFLLWVGNIENVISEIESCLVPGGIWLALNEPDYLFELGDFNCENQKEQEETISPLSNNSELLNTMRTALKSENAHLDNIIKLTKLLPTKNLYIQSSHAHHTENFKKHLDNYEEYKNYLTLFLHKESSINFSESNNEIPIIPTYSFIIHKK